MRKRSPETQLRYAKTEIRKAELLIQALRQELEQRRLSGAMMANLCYNGSQLDEVPELVRENMRECQARWDKIKAVKL